MDVNLDKWHKCKVDIKVLKELSKKSDLKGLQHISIFFVLLIISLIFTQLLLFCLKKSQANFFDTAYTPELIFIFRNGFS